jgi:hypothetical protein
MRGVWSILIVVQSPAIEHMVSLQKRYYRGFLLEYNPQLTKVGFHGHISHTNIWVSEQYLCRTTQLKLVSLFVYVYKAMHKACARFPLFALVFPFKETPFMGSHRRRPCYPGEKQ